MKVYISVFLAIVLSACGAGGFGRVEPIGADVIAGALGDLKRQLAVYQFAVAGGLPSTTTDGKPIRGPFICGTGKPIVFDIETINVKLTVSNSISAGGEVSTLVSPFGFGGGYAFTNSDLQELNLLLVPGEGKTLASAGGGTLADAPIAQQILNVRDGSLQAATMEGACLRYHQTNDKANSYKIGISIKRETGGNISVGLAPMALGATGELVSTTGSEIVVNFKARKASGQEPDNTTFMKPFVTRPQ